MTFTIIISAAFELIEVFVDCLLNKFALLSSKLILVVSFHSNLYAQEVLFISLNVGGLNLALPFSKRRSCKSVHVL